MRSRTILIMEDGQVRCLYTSYAKSKVVERVPSTAEARPAGAGVHSSLPFIGTVFSSQIDGCEFVRELVS